MQAVEESGVAVWVAAGMAVEAKEVVAKAKEEADTEVVATEEGALEVAAPEVGAPVVAGTDLGARAVAARAAVATETAVQAVEAMVGAAQAEEAMARVAAVEVVKEVREAETEVAARKELSRPQRAGCDPPRRLTQGKRRRTSRRCSHCPGGRRTGCRGWPGRPSAPSGLLGDPPGRSPG